MGWRRFFVLGSCGPHVYQGKNMLSAHKNMCISANEFMVAVDDLMQALTGSGIGDREKSEVLCMFYTLRPGVDGAGTPDWPVTRMRSRVSTPVRRQSLKLRLTLIWSQAQTTCCSCSS